jgi:hypothetical protein
MAGDLARVLHFETDWLRGYARTYLPVDCGFSYSASLLRAKGVTLLDVMHLFATGVVTWSDKLDEPGAVWVVEGEDCDGRNLVATIIVESQKLKVSLEQVERNGRNDGNDAA